MSEKAIKLVFLALAAALAVGLIGRMGAPERTATPLPVEPKDITLPTGLPVPTPPTEAPPQAAPERRNPAPPPPAPAPAARELPAPAPTPPESTLSDREFYERYAPAVIQIFCLGKQELFSASGIVVNGRGLVLTNAHVADVIKKTGQENCQARHGNPAEPFAGLEIVFVADTAPKIPETEVPQRDIAFLRLVEPRAAFAVAPIRFATAEIGETLYTLGYPSEFLEGAAASANSNLVFSVLRVDNYADIDDELATAEGYVFRGGIVLQQGSSGTAVFSRSGGVLGIIFATTKGATTADREGVALTTSYIDRMMRLEVGRGLAEFIASH